MASTIIAGTSGSKSRVQEVSAATDPSSLTARSATLNSLCARAM
ncbi:MAG: hypothetical protein P8N02_04835 [Actinomycetota bacterium]|nr:hypothetical protein [Actinomycetota bacterium]